MKRQTMEEIPWVQGGSDRLSKRTKITLTPEMDHHLKWFVIAKALSRGCGGWTSRSKALDCTPRHMQNPKIGTNARNIVSTHLDVGGKQDDSYI
jgi:hypothetical protein